MELQEKTIPEQNKFWNETIKKFSHLKGLVNCSLGMMNKSEFEMLKSVGAISNKGVVADGYNVIVNKNGLDQSILMTNSYSRALATKSEIKESRIERLSIMYSNYLDYISRLNYANNEQYANETM